MNKLRVGSWVRYKIEKAKNSSNDPFSIPSSTSGEKEVYAVVIQIDDNNCTITYTCQDELYNVPVFKTVLTSIDSVEMVCPSGRCPEDDILATSEYNCSGYQPNAGSKFDLKKSISTNPPHISTSNKEAAEKVLRDYVDISAYANPETDYSDSLFDPNEKDPVMRALNMVKEYCNVSIREINQNRAISTDCFKADAYQDVINFIEEHQKKCHDVESYSSLDLDKLIESTDSSYIEHLENEIEWFKGRMEQYRKSFFMVCNLIDTCGVPESIKYFVKQEELRY